MKIVIRLARNVDSCLQTSRFPNAHKRTKVSSPHTLNAIYPSTDKQCALGFYEFFGSESLKDKGYIIRYFILDTTTSLINLDFEKKNLSLDQEKAGRVTEHIQDKFLSERYMEKSLYFAKL